MKINHMKIIPALMALMAVVPFTCWGEPLSGEEIMTRADERYDGDSSRQTTEIRITNSRGSTRIRELISYSKDYGKDEKTVMVFLEPADVEGVGYLSYTYDELGRDDDTWLFLPALKRSRRISGSSRNDYFMGTDFTYDDMGDRKVKEDRHTFLREEELNGQLCWVVESVPLESRDMYSKRISWIRQDLDMRVKVEYYDRQGEFQKTLEIPQIRRIDGVWTAEKMVMTNHLENHSTVLEFKNVQYNIPVEDTFFSVATLERGRIR
jgi:hypothetical protein